MSPLGAERDWPDPAEILGESAVDFTLVYRGPLPAASQSETRRDQKHAIRLALSPQILELWKTEPKLHGHIDGVSGGPRGRESIWQNDQLIRIRQPGDAPENMGPCKWLEMKGSRFTPTMTRENGLQCHLDIKFLRRGARGHLVSKDGDLDNRLKVLFDGLRIPQSPDEVDAVPNHPRDVYCLLEDDSLITKFTIEAQTLLDPETAGRPQTYVELHVSIHAKATR